MSITGSLVKDFMNISPDFVYENDDIDKVLKIMKKHKIDTLPVVDKLYSTVGLIKKEELLKFVTVRKNINLKKLKLSDFLDFSQDTVQICIYPRTTVQDAYWTMKQFDLKALPVIDCIYGKKLLGCIRFNDIQRLFQPLFVVSLIHFYDSIWLIYHNFYAF